MNTCLNNTYLFMNTLYDVCLFLLYVRGRVLRDYHYHAFVFISIYRFLLSSRGENTNSREVKRVFIDNNNNNSMTTLLTMLISPKGFFGHRCFKQVL